ncbi:HDOD domain-containing protein [Thiomicrorhabdus aquaedulcis]|uniref:HDOD domain-containing protein n=1 Tax=Thiomicrorhabdus aquaedulcis TaxID=2211106 RepID=UPI000FD9FB9D|nr:HDOD domain-containing protein [Thiomicrorhabdus aquaedulcis]
MKIEMKLGMDEAIKLIQSCHIDTVPAEIYQLDELMLAPNPNSAHVAQLLSKNPEILGEFLSLANRVLNKSPDDLIFEASGAVNLLGLDEIKRLFLSSYLTKNLPISTEDHKLIVNCHRAGIAAAELSYWVNDISRTEAFFITFLQDIGVIYMMRYDPDYYAQTFLNAQLTSPFSAYEKEFEHYQTAHTFVGSVITRRWHLGDLLSKSLLLHHQESLESVMAYDAKVAKMVALMQLANVLTFKVFSDHYETAELKQIEEHTVRFLALPDNAVQAAQAALKKWGEGINDHVSSH